MPVRNTRFLLPMVLFAAGLLTGGFGLRWLYQESMSDFWQRQWETIPEEQALTLMQQLAAVDLDRCVEALGASRPALAQAAQRALRERIGAWRQLPPPQALTCRQRLAAALAEQVESLPADGRSAAADLARALLNWPDAPQVDTASLLACCDRVLRIEAQRRPSPSIGASEPPPESVEARRQRADATAAARDTLALSRLSGGALPIVSAAPDPAPVNTTAGPQVAAGRPPSEPRLLSSAATSAQPVHSLRQPSSLLAVPDSDRTETPASQRTAVRPAPRPGGMRRLSLEDPDSLSDDTRRQLQSVTTRELIGRLQSSDSAVAAAARIELESRGFTKIDFELARQLEDPSPNVRQQLVEALPDMPGVHASTWLLWLCEDQDPDVSLAAATWIATTADPGLVAKLESIANRHSDSRIRRVLEQCQRRRPGR